MEGNNPNNKGSSSLTAEQKKRIEENRTRALEKLKQKQGNRPQPSPFAYQKSSPGFSMVNDQGSSTSKDAKIGSSSPVQPRYYNWSNKFSYDSGKKTTICQSPSRKHCPDSGSTPSSSRGAQSPNYQRNGNGGQWRKLSFLMGGGASAVNFPSRWFKVFCLKT